MFSAVILFWLSLTLDFEKKGKKETCPMLDQFLCHIAKTGDALWVLFYLTVDPVRKV